MFHFHPFPPHVVVHLIGMTVFAIAAFWVARKFVRARYLAVAANSRFSSRTSNGSGNLAFDDYRRATLDRLEAEADEFRKYLDRLRRTADAVAFESFLKSRRSEVGPAS
jgi:hypothetical protein